MLNGIISARPEPTDARLEDISFSSQGETAVVLRKTLNNQREYEIGNQIAVDIEWIELPD